MPPLRLDVKLRRILTDLSAMHADDMEDILTALTDEERSQVDKLMHRIVGQFDATGDFLEIGYDSKRLSPWLGRLLFDTYPEQGSMTTLARDVLRQCAASLYPRASAK